MLPYALQDVDEVVVRVDVVKPAGDEQTLHDANVLGSQLGPAEEPVASTHGNHAQCAFDMVRIDRHLRIIEKDLKPLPPFAHVVQRFRERTARQKSLCFEELVHPCEELIDDGFGVSLSFLSLPVTSEISFANLSVGA